MASTGAPTFVPHAAGLACRHAQQLSGPLHYLYDAQPHAPLCCPCAVQVHDPAVPPHISMAAAESVAFIGKAVLLLKNPAGAFRGAELLRYKDTLEFTQVRRALTPFTLEFMQVLELTQVRRAFTQVRRARCVYV